MIKKFAKVALVGVMAAALCSALALGGCGSTKTGATLSESIDAESAHAMVSSVDGDTITVQVMADMEKSDSDKSKSDKSSSSEGSDSSSSDKSSADTSSTDKSSSSDSSDSSSSDKSSSDSSSAAPSGQPPQGSDSDGGTPPEKPSGDNASGSDSSSSSSSDSATPLEKPSGSDDSSSSSDSSDSSSDKGGAPSDANGMKGGTEATLTISDESIIYTSDSDNKETQGSIDDITEGCMLELTIENGTGVTKIVVTSSEGMGQGGQPGQDSGKGGSNSSSSGEVNNGDAATTIKEDATASGKTYKSTSSDENAVRTSNSATVTLKDATVTKSGDSSDSESSDFYGLNAGVLAMDSSNLTMSGATITTKSKGSNGIFAYGSGTSVTVSNTKIRTSKGNSGGIEVAGGASLTAKNLDVETQGESSAAIRSDRGGGTETVTGGTFTTHGKSSPAVYSTADVSVSKATLASENAQAVVIEGANSVKLSNCKVTGNKNGTAYRTKFAANVMIYQSMSGDASEGEGTFTMDGGTFTAQHGSLFYVTNTTATINLTGVKIKGAYDKLMTIAGNSVGWGEEGSNGATVTATASDQTLKGAITVDKNSSLSLSLKDGSSLKGTINKSGKAGTVKVTLDSDSTWTLTGDSYVSSLSGCTSNINLNGHTLYVNGKKWSK